VLHREITTLGYRGGASILRTYLRPLRETMAPPPRQAPPSVREVTGWMTKHPDSLDEQEKQRLAAVLERCPELQVTAGHVRAFATMMHERAGRELNTWMGKVHADDIPELRSFLTGITIDHDAVTAGLTLPYSSGVVEGHVNRIKMLKRQMYGRAGFDLLRARVLHCPHGRP
jgi:transposase